MNVNKVRSIKSEALSNSIKDSLLNIESYTNAIAEEEFKAGYLDALWRVRIAFADYLDDTGASHSEAKPYFNIIKELEARASYDAQ